MCLRSDQRIIIVVQVFQFVVIALNGEKKRGGGGGVREGHILFYTPFNSFLLLKYLFLFVTFIFFA